jgi:hypothetical protein
VAGVSDRAFWRNDCDMFGGETTAASNSATGVMTRRARWHEPAGGAPVGDLAAPVVCGAVVTCLVGDLVSGRRLLHALGHDGLALAHDTKETMEEEV